jgi:hypothetical protein
MSRGPQPTPITLTDRQTSVLGQITRRQTAAQNIVRRATLILTLGQGVNNQQGATRLCLNRETMRTWRERWLEAAPGLGRAELVTDFSDQELSRFIETVLADAPRPGAPATLTPEEIVHIVAVA